MGVVSGKYFRRIQAAGRESINLRNKVRQLMKRGLVETTDEQLYDQTTLEVTGRMRKSIKTRLVPGGVEAFFDASVAPHAKSRLNMKGTSKKGGHRLDMAPSEGLRARVDPERLRLEREAHRRTLEGN